MTAAIVTYPWYVGAYWAFIGATVAVYALIALSLSFLGGWLGQISLAHAAFTGLAAFGMAQLQLWGVHWFLAILTLLLASIPVSIVVGAPSLRFRGAYFTIASVAFVIAVNATLFQHLRSNQVTIVTRPPDLGVDLYDNRYFYYLAVAAALIGFAVVLRLRRTTTLLTFLTIRDAEPAAKTFGIRPTTFKLYAFVISGCLATLAGVVLGMLIGIASPNTYDFDASLSYLAITIIGGLGSLLGAVCAGIVQGITPQISDALAAGDATAVTPLVVSALAFLTILTAPAGIAGNLHRLANRFRRTPAYRPELAVSASGRGDSAGLRIALPPTPAESAPMRLQSFSAPAPHERGLLVRGVSRSFGGVRALNQIDLFVPTSDDAEAGLIVAVIGPNGAGKTTLFNCLSGLQHVDAGAVTVDGCDVLAEPPERRALAFGFSRTFQTPQLVSGMTSLDAVKLGVHARFAQGPLGQLGLLPKARREQRTQARVAAETLDELGLTALADELVGSLPASTRRLVEIARALAGRPRFLFLDEPTAGLDRSEREWVRAVVRWASRSLGTNVLLIEHDMDVVMDVSDYVYVLDFGEVVSHGTPERVRADRRVIAAYLGSRSLVQAPAAAASIEFRQSTT